MPRSLLYVPAHNEKMVAGAARRGADALIVDLEDSVPESAKESARSRLPQSIRLVGEQGASVFVRTNGSWSLAWRDMEAAAAAGATGLMLPKIDSPGKVEALGGYLIELEERFELEPLALLLTVESAPGLAAVQEIAAALAGLTGPGEGAESIPEAAALAGLTVPGEGAASIQEAETKALPRPPGSGSQPAAGTRRGAPRLTGLVPGNEDLSLSLQVQPEPELMAGALWPLITAARAHGHALIGSVGSGAEYRDLEAYRRRVELGRRYGFDGATCIHPAQVEVVNQVYLPSGPALDWARKVVAAFEERGGEAVGVDGQMIDRPVYLRAKRLVEEAKR